MPEKAIKPEQWVVIRATAEAGALKFEAFGPFVNAEAARIWIEASDKDVDQIVIPVVMNPR